jgi:hypothetical protein
MGFFSVMNLNPKETGFRIVLLAPNQFPIKKMDYDLGAVF